MYVLLYLLQLYGKCNAACVVLNMSINYGLVGNVCVVYDMNKKCM